MNNNIVTKRCFHCGKTKKVAEFLKNRGIKDKYDNWCSLCRKKYCIDERTLKEYLVANERGFNPNLFKRSINDAEIICKRENIDSDMFVDEVLKLAIRKYFQGMHLINQEGYPIKTKKEEKEENNIKTRNIKIDPALEDKWGSGYKPIEYELFEKKWKELINNYGEKSALHIENLKVYIRYRVKEEIATAEGSVKDAKEWGTLASKAAQDAKINVSQLSKADLSGGVDLVCQIFEAVESELGVIPLLPKLLEQPYDDADIIIWSNINYLRRLEDKPMVKYRDIWNFYDEMLEEVFIQQGYTIEEIEMEKNKRNNVFRDLEKIYVEPLYQDDDIGGDEDT